MLADLFGNDKNFEFFISYDEVFPQNLGDDRDIFLPELSLLSQGNSSIDSKESIKEYLDSVTKFSEPEIHEEKIILEQEKYSTDAKSATASCLSQESRASIDLLKTQIIIKNKEVQVIKSCSKKIQKAPKINNQMVKKSSNSPKPAKQKVSSQLGHYKESTAKNFLKKIGKLNQFKVQMKLPKINLQYFTSKKVSSFIATHKISDEDVWDYLERRDPEEFSEKYISSNKILKEKLNRKEVSNDAVITEALEALFKFITGKISARRC